MSVCSVRMAHWAIVTVPSLTAHCRCCLLHLCPLPLISERFCHPHLCPTAIKTMVLLPLTHVPWCHSNLDLAVTHTCVLLPLKPVPCCHPPWYFHEEGSRKYKSTEVLSSGISSWRSNACHYAFIWPFLEWQFD